MRALLKRDMVTLIEVDELREFAGVFLVEKPGKVTQRLIVDARVSNLPAVSLVKSEGLSRVEVTLENDDVDPGELSRLARLHVGLADVKDAFHRLKISKRYSSFLPFLKWKVQKWEHLWLDACAPVLATNRWVTPGVFFLPESNRRGNVATPSLDIL